MSTKSNNRTNPTRRRIMSSIAEVYAIVLTFLLPIKMGSIAGIPEITLLYPDDIFSWLLISWPTEFFNLLSSVLLALVLVSARGPIRFFGRSGQTTIAWVALAFCSMIGVINASCADFSISQINHMFGIAAYALAIWRLVEERPKIKEWLLASIVFGTLMSMFFGLHQLFAGFEETRHYVYDQELKSGIKNVGTFQTRLYESRVFANFALCNSFAAHLILTLPLCVCWFWRLGAGKMPETTGKFKISPLLLAFFIFAFVNSVAFPAMVICFVCGWLFWRYLDQQDSPALTRWVMIPPVALALLFVLYWTSSRAAILSLGIAVGVLLVALPLPKKVRFATLALIVIGTIGGMVAVNLGRGVESMIVRFDYFRVAFNLFLKEPWFGAGWGDFFHEYTTLKSYPGDESPHTPHNLILAFLSQTGIVGGIVAVLALLLPFWHLLRSVKKVTDWRQLLDSTAPAVLLGWSAWVIHAMADINLQIPGTVAIGLAMVLVITSKSDDETQISNSARPFFFVWIVLAGFVAVFTFHRSVAAIRGEMAFHDLQNYCDPRFKKPEEFARLSMFDMRQLLEKCEKLKPDSPFHYATASNFAMMKMSPVEAETYMKKVIERSPERSSFHWHLYLIQEQLGKHQEALKSYENAKKTFPNHTRFKK